ncbi:MAG TPA: metallophosphoesterase [Acidimicrobiia bacterium]|nr:metallophosphoesterase [Acidimicrobiia bacterium]
MTIRRPRSDQPRDLGFTPQPMVEWLSPGELLKAALRVLLSGVFGAYADKRELQGVWAHGEPHDYSDRPDLWIDYVADVADGFDATMTVASTLGRDAVGLSTEDGQVHPTRRGDILIMGGDQVYPTADYQNYRNRLIGPYRAALPAVEGDRPDLFAIPGNHDWYDGLTSFLRVFCQEETIGAWQTRQRRSYFALQLPRGWWLWGIDIQFESYLDASQLNYFSQVVGPQMQKGDSVILCSASPSWLQSNMGEPDAYENIDLLEREIVTPRGAKIRLAISGDKHHYARYYEVDGDGQRITSGGGGAYLSATHQLPDDIAIPPEDSTDLKKSPPVDYRLATTYPSKTASRRLRFGVLRLPWQNGSFWGLVAVVYLIVGWSVLLGLRLPGENFADLLRTTSWSALLSGMFARPVGFVMAIGLVAGLAAFNRSANVRKRWVFGTIHAVAHLVLVLGTIWVSAWLLSDLADPLVVIGSTVLLGFVGGLLGSWLVAVYLLVADHFHSNTNELYAAQHIEGFNNFVRMHFAPDGSLTMYPVQIQGVVRWLFQPEGDDSTPWFSPKGAAPRPKLIEHPIRIEPLRRG